MRRRLKMRCPVCEDLVYRKYAEGQWVEQKGVLYCLNQHGKFEENGSLGWVWVPNPISED
jgi:hypothetical protein